MKERSQVPAGGAKATPSLAVEAFVTLVGALFAFLALDDITTDNATTGFVPEYRLLACYGLWLLFFVFQLWRKQRRLMAGVSLLLLGAGAWAAHDGIGHTNAGGWNTFWPEYTVITMAWLWFLVVSIRLLGQAFRRQGAAAA